MSRLINHMVLFLLLLPTTAIANRALPDPTRPANYVEPQKRPPSEQEKQAIPLEKIDWVLSAIKISDKDKLAVVNGELVREGDVVGPARLIAIKHGSVVVDHNGNEITIRLFRHDVTKNHGSTN